MYSNFCLVFVSSYLVFLFSLNWTFRIYIKKGYHNNNNWALRLVWWEKPHGLVRTRHWIYKFLKINVAVLCSCYFQKNRGLPPYSPSVLKIVNSIYCSTWKQRKHVTFLVHHSLISQLKQNAPKKTSSTVCKANFPSSRARYLTLIICFLMFSTLISFPYFKKRLASHGRSLRLQSLNDP